MRGLIRYFVKYNLTGDLLMIAILAAGFVGLNNLRSNFFPEVDSKTIHALAWRHMGRYLHEVVLRPGP